MLRRTRRPARLVRHCSAVTATTLAAILGTATLSGCSASYATPGGPAELRQLGVNPAAAAAAEATNAGDRFTDGSISDALAKRPLATFPAGVAVARVQAPGYKSATAEGWGTGTYSIVTTRDVEVPEQVARLAKLPGVAGIAPLNRLLLPQRLNSDLELRQAAAALHADVLLIYTFDTTFTVDDQAAPLSVVTLGLSPTQVARVVCTASAALMDTRNGYLYGVAEGTDRQTQLASAWTSTAAVDAARRRAESTAFEKLMGELETTWKGVYAANAGRPAGPPQASPTARQEARPGVGHEVRPTVRRGADGWEYPS